jgi:hypothetical protein
MSRSRLFFDPEDQEILDVVNPVLTGRKRVELLRNLFDPSLHPRGIKELGAPRSLRVAFAVFELVDSLEQGLPAERVRTLRSVHDEVLHNGSPSLRRNTARVLLEIMKELVRAQGDEERQLQLAHDFRQATTGKPRLIRRLLREFHLLEMPEDWSQMAFDHHVHDANSKGRKSPTHLVMDAWIKGIRHLNVVYYNYVRPEAAAELLEAAEIVNVRVRAGVEISATLRGKPVRLIWAPRGFKNREDFIAFLTTPGMQELMDAGREMSEHKTRGLIQRLEHFNAAELPGINETYGISVPPLGAEEFLRFVGAGQASELHLAEFIHSALLPHLERRVGELREGGTGDGRELFAAMDRLVPEAIAEQYLGWDPPPQPDGAALLGIGVPELLGMLEQAPRGSRVILNPSNLSADEVLEVLYEGQGRITHLEVFNAKDWAEGRIEHREAIDRVRRVLNGGNLAEGKELILELLDEVESSDLPDRDDRARKLRQMLEEMPRFQGFYRYGHLKSRLGSDSTGRSRHSRGMGLVVVPSLPRRSRRRVRRERRMLPVATTPQLQVTWSQRHSPRPLVDRFYGLARRLPLLRGLGYRGTRRWIAEPNSTCLCADGNIASLGGIDEDPTNGFSLEPGGGKRRTAPPLRYLNTPTENLLKVLVGFVPAFLTFYLTKSWWVLAYLGAVIWFAITGLRNIVQSVLGGGGLLRSPLLHWKDFISWGRVADSLLFTGFSVPLLDYLVKTLLLDRSLGITTATSPILLYTVIALANGLYIFSHNVFRGLPMTAAVGNFFRTVISIPIAIGINNGVAEILHAVGVPEADIFATLQLWAAVISKAASDVVAGVIEGLADRGVNLALRAVDYEDKRRQMQEIQGQLALLFTDDKDVAELLEQPKQLVAQLRGKEGEILLRHLAVHGLDYMYFWMFQPRGRHTFRRLLRVTPPAERRFIVRAQRVLERKRYLSEMLIGGLVGKQFDRALAFYLGRVDSYLRQVRRYED